MRGFLNGDVRRNLKKIAKEMYDKGQISKETYDEYKILLMTPGEKILDIEKKLGVSLR